MVARLPEDTKLIGGKMTEKKLAKELTEKIAREIFDDIEKYRSAIGLSGDFEAIIIPPKQWQALKERYGINT